MTIIRQVWPESSGRALTDDAVLTAYGPLVPPAGRPAVRVNFVASLDGASAVAGHSAGLSSPADQRLLTLLRVECDALMVGAGTLRQERYGSVRMASEQQRQRQDRGRHPHPVLVIVSARLELDPGHAMFADAPVRPIVVTSAAAPADRRRALSSVSEVLVCGETAVDLAAAVGALAALGQRLVLSEGGPRMFGALLADGLVDELCLTVSPLLAGPGADRVVTGSPTPMRPMRLVHLLTDGAALFTRYAATT